MTLELEKIPATPHVVPVLSPLLAGVDYLNLRQVNLDLMGECIPGTNNATRLVRGYSVIAWVYWIYPKVLDRLGRDQANSEELIHFREKVESLFVWGHQLENLVGLPGVSAKVPEPNNGKTDLRFKAWKRSRSNTSFEAAVQYGPSLSDLGGLGLIHKVSAGVYVCTPVGERLGEALDRQLRGSSAYEFLTEINNLNGTPELAKQLLPFWHIHEISPLEAEVFRSALWTPAHQSESNNRGRRACMIELLLDCLRNAGKPLEEFEIRKRLALPGLWRESPLPEGQLKQSRSWLALQFRQLQRLAFEGLMSWVEVQLTSFGHMFPDKMVEQAWEDFSEKFELMSPTTTRQVLQKVGNPVSDLETFEQLIKSAPESISPWDLAENLREAIRRRPHEVHVLAFHVLIVLFQNRSLMESDPLLKRHIELGGSARISFAHWFGLMERFIDHPFRQVIDWSLKNLIISQHLAVATQRYDGEKVRLRMVLEEDGLEPLIAKNGVWKPALTPDRLTALLSLLQSCETIKTDEDGCFSIAEENKIDR